MFERLWLSRAAVKARQMKAYNVLVCLYLFLPYKETFAPEMYIRPDIVFSVWICLFFNEGNDWQGS